MIAVCEEIVILRTGIAERTLEHFKIIEIDLRILCSKCYSDNSQAIIPPSYCLLSSLSSSLLHPPSIAEELSALAPHLRCWLHLVGFWLSQLPPSALIPVSSAVKPSTILGLQPSLSLGLHQLLPVLLLPKSKW